jgi:uncharacterized protein (TIGR02271 family)
MENPNSAPEGFLTGNRSAAADVGAGVGAEVVLHQERLGITTRRLPVEKVRFTKRIVTTTRTIEVPVRVEQLVVTHEPLSDEFPVTDGEVFPELVMVLHEEVPEVTLRVVPVERVSVAVRTVTRDEVVVAELATEVVDVTRT